MVNLFKPFPFATAVLFVLTAVASSTALAYPSIELDLRRDPILIAHGEWWRLGSSLVVQDGGVLGTLSNLGFLLVLGVLTERSLGPLRTVALYVAGAACGQAAGLLFDTIGAGNSIAVCGLAGGLMCAVLFGTADAVAGVLATLWALLIGTTAVSGFIGVVLVAAAVVVVSQAIRLRDRLPSWVYAAAGAIVGVALTIATNLHGPALLGGLLVGLGLARRHRVTA